MLDALWQAVYTLVINDAPLYLAAVLVFLAGKFAYDLITPFNLNEELVVKDNPAVGIALAGYYVGLGLIVAGALSGAPQGAVADFTALLTWGGIGIVGMIVARWSNDALILNRIANASALSEHQHAGVGAALAGSYVGTGFLIQGVVVNGGSPVEEGGSLMMTGALMAVLFVVGQIALLVASWLYRLLANYDVQEAIDRPEGLSAGIGLGGFLVAVGIVLRAATRTPYNDILTVTVLFIAYTIIGIALLALTYILVDRLFVKGTVLSREVSQQNNIAAGLLKASASIVIALLQDVAL